MALKYVLEALMIYHFQSRILSTAEFLSPTLSGKQAAYAPKGFSQTPFIIAYFSSLLFLWVGLSMTARRAFDAGKNPWILLFFFLPYLNLILMLALSWLPSIPNHENKIKKEQITEPFKATFAALLGFALIGTLALALLTFVTKTYGAVLFAATPFAMGATVGYFLNRHQIISTQRTIVLVIGTLALWSGFIFFFALEGAVCMAMAAPIVLVMSMLGAVIGRNFAKAQFFKSNTLSAMFLLPVLLGGSWFENKVQDHLQGEVISSVIINAPIEAVWKNVVIFPKISEPDEFIFKAGVSYPIQARIEGTGVGAIRYCEFNAGSFVEPITRWEENKRLSFDVRFQPKPMKELSLWQNIEAPHLDGFFKSKRGEFRLKELPDHRTLLEGSTWYDLQIFPSQYWQFYSEMIVHKIHMRVLNHIKNNVETTANAT